MAIDSSSLRAARQSRIASRQASSESAQSYNPTQTEQTAPEAAPAVPETLVASVLDPKAVSKSAEVTMHLYNEKSSDPHWIVCAGGIPVAQIRLSDQDEVDRTAKIFTTAQYADAIIESAKQLDMSELLSGVHARPFVASVESAEVFKSVKEAMASEAKEQLRRAKANLRGDMINMLNLVVTAQSKNFIQANELKDNMFRKMRESGIEQDRAVAIIEAAWQEKAASYFEDTFNQASKWMDMSPEAFAEVKEQIVGTQNRTPSIEVSASANDRLIPKESSNIPLLTTASIDPNANRTASVDEKASMREKLGFRSRSLNKQMTTR